MKKIFNDLVVAIFTYNQEGYIEESITSIYNQTIWPKVLYIFDDCSSDNTIDIIHETISKKPNGLNVEIVLNDINVGLSSQLNKLSDMFNETLIVVQAGDDISKLERLNKQYNEWKNNKDVNLVLSQFDKINEDSTFVSGRDIKENFQHNIKHIVNRRIIPAGCTAAIDSSLFNDFKPIAKDVISEDRIFILRSLLKGRAIKIMEPLISYRYNVGISTLNTRSRKEYIDSWRVMFNRELTELSANILDCKEVGNDKFIVLFMKRERYVLILNDLFHGEFISKKESYIQFFKRGVNPFLIFSFRQKVRRYFKNKV
ncbi:glycosyltransferase [Aliivibrio finisterrensis]|uniref:Glycosyltransferase n=1 Tax=Aliivibrio finisterrensis TaxID=511998 RepID=A0A6N6RPT1_9GAMM|nr:glycosyltransferase [Aliivibrio finisterrensis]KAB2823517.1 glycosyltransferase [Aliivibrio finisterrensis]